MRRWTLLLVMIFVTLGMAQAQRTVSGTVTDENGVALIGASVLAKGTSAGTITNVDGQYRLEVPAGSNVLIYSYTGFTTQEISLGASNIVDVSMSEGVTLETAVVTALGISKEEKSLGYAVKSVDGSAVVRSGEINVVQGLAAKSSGVQVIGSGVHLVLLPRS
ncbi:MAG: carboxypeptidase-like regulatory domain-containing protein [Saprospiraceae bacterium]|nr:carboxypeptidase-like regulatory domain-containing protein [Saprospiraceae bacterium]